MSNNSPVFGISDNQQHFGDYGFHPHFDYFQVLEEARKHKSENEGRAPSSARCLHFKLQKANISQQLNNNANTMKKNNMHKHWWKNALLFFIKTKCTSSQDHHHRQQSGVHPINSYAPPVYTTESRSTGTASPYRTTSRPTSGQLSPAMMGDINNMPYINLDDINTDQQNSRPSAISTMPIYLVT